MKKIFFLLFTCLMAASLSSCSEDSTAQGEVIRSIDDLNGKDVVVIGGSVQDLLASKRLPDSQILRTDTDSDSYTMLASGKVPASVYSDISWSMAKDSYPDIVAVGDTLAPQPIGFAFKKGQEELIGKFNAFLKQYLAETDMEKTAAEWTDPESDKRMPDPDEVSGANGTLHFVTAAITPPMEFVKYGEVSGIEPEILARFAMSQDMKWDFTDISFSGLIAYIQSGKADAGCCIMCITPERQESVDFSDPWRSESSIVLVNRKYAPAELAGDTTVGKEPFFKRIKDSFVKSLIKEDRYKMLLQGLWATIIIALLAALFGTILGMCLCYTSMRRNKIVSGISNLFIEFMRCMPQVVFLMIMFYIVFGKSDIDGQWVAVIAFSLCFAAYTSVIFRTSVQSIDKGQTEAALSMGFGKFSAFTHIILPQAVQRALPVYKGEFIGLVKATSIVGYIAVFDLTKAGDIIRSRTYEAFFPLILVTIIYFLVIWVLTISLKYIEAKTQPKRKKFFK